MQLTFWRNNGAVSDSSSNDYRPAGFWGSLAQLISWGTLFYVFALLIEPVERDLGLNRVQSSLAFSLALLMEGMAAYPVGRWIDRGWSER